MLSLRKHVQRQKSGQFITLPCQIFNVARLGGRVAGNIDDFARPRKGYCLQNGRATARARRIQEDYVCFIFSG